MLNPRLATSLHSHLDNIHMSTLEISLSQRLFSIPANTILAEVIISTWISAGIF